jgi:hypothetical protein
MVSFHGILVKHVLLTMKLHDYFSLPSIFVLLFCFTFSFLPFLFFLACHFLFIDSRRFEENVSRITKHSKDMRLRCLDDAARSIVCLDIFHMLLTTYHLTIYIFLNFDTLEMEKSVVMRHLIIAAIVSSDRMMIVRKCLE